MGKKGGNLSQDFDLFGGMLAEEGADEEKGGEVGGDVLGGILDDVDISTKTDDDATKPEDGADKPEPKDDEPVKDDKKDEPIITGDDKKDDSKDDDIDSILDEIMNATVDIDDKVDDVKEAAVSTGDEGLIKLVDELQNMLIEKNQDIEQLTKQNELISTRAGDSYADAENFGYYKGVITSLEDNPKLMQLVKYINSDNEKMKSRTVDILSDLIYEKTGEDISDLINAKQKEGITDALSDFSGGGEPGVPSGKEEETEITREDSLNKLF